MTLLQCIPFMNKLVFEIHNSENFDKKFWNGFSCFDLIYYQEYWTREYEAVFSNTGFVDLP